MAEHTCWTRFLPVQAVVHAGAYVQSSGEVDCSCMMLTSVLALIWVSGRFTEYSATIYFWGYCLCRPVCAAAEGFRPRWVVDGFRFYGFSKLLAEDVLMRLHQHILKLCMLRPTSIYGHGIGEDKMVPRFLATATRNEVIELSHPVEDRVDIVHAADVADAARHSIRSAVKPSMFLLILSLKKPALQLLEASLRFNAL